MQVKINLLLGHYLIFYSQLNYINAKPLIGHNIRNTRETEYPYVVSLMQMSPINQDPVENHICTGTLVTRRDVVTAEHCLLIQNDFGFKIVAGSNDLRRCQIFYIYWWITFIQWATQINLMFQFTVNDVANIRLTRTIHRSIVPARIPSMNNEDLYGVEAMIVAWGQTNETYLSPLLKKTKVTVLDNEYCSQRLTIVANEEMNLDYRQALCTAAIPYVLLYKGDSGGPLLYRNYIVGVNKGTCPNNVDTHNPGQVNLHMSINYYKHFLFMMHNSP